MSDDAGIGTQEMHALAMVSAFRLPVEVAAVVALCWSPEAKEQAGDGGAANAPEKRTLSAVVVGAAAPAEGE